MQLHYILKNTLFILFEEKKIEIISRRIPVIPKTEKQQLNTAY